MRITWPALTDSLNSFSKSTCRPFFSASWTAAFWVSDAKAGVSMNRPENIHQAPTPRAAVSSRMTMNQAMPRRRRFACRVRSRLTDGDGGSAGRS